MSHQLISSPINIITHIITHHQCFRDVPILNGNGLYIDILTTSATYSHIQPHTATPTSHSSNPAKAVTANDAKRYIYLTCAWAGGRGPGAPGNIGSESDGPRGLSVNAVLQYDLLAGSRNLLCLHNPIIPSPGSVLAKSISSFPNAGCPPLVFRTRVDPVSCGPDRNDL